MSKLTRIFLALLTLSIIMPLGYSTATAFAQTSGAYDNVDVITDVKEILKETNLTPTEYFNKNKDKDISILRIQEFGWSYYASKRQDYGLYIYIFNPKQLNINTISQLNRVQMKVNDSVGYRTYKILPTSVSDGELERVYYKFKVYDLSYVQYLDLRTRVYDISGIELIERSNSSAKEYGIAGSYKFKGFAKGLAEDPNLESTLKEEVDKLEILKLQIKKANWRSEEISSLGDGHYNEINSVYFSIPKEVLTKYGNLQTIKAEYEEYKTTPMIVTIDQNIYDELYNFMGVSLTGNNQPKYSLSINLKTNQYTPIVVKTSDWHYGPDNVKANQYQPKAWAKRIDYIFKTTYTDNKYDDVTDDTVKEWINARSGDDILKSGLVLDTVDKGHTLGYNLVNINPNDKFNLISYDDVNNLWDKWMEFGFFAPKTDGEYKNIKPIEPIIIDQTHTPTSLADKYFVSNNDSNDFYNYAKDTPSNMVPYIFRFSQNDYYTKYCQVNTDNGPIGRNSVMMVQESIFRNFNILELKFKNKEELTVIPVVADPIDIINGITPPPPSNDQFNSLIITIFAVGIILITLSLLLKLRR